MSEVQVVLHGYVGQEVKLQETVRGDVVTFRVGTTPRIRTGGVFTDGETVWTSVRCWRFLAQNVASSLNVGDPVVVVGKMRTSRWETADGEPRERSFVEATTVAHDLARGTSVFRKNTRPSFTDHEQDADLNAALEESERSAVAIDPQTGEVVGSRAASPGTGGSGGATGSADASRKAGAEGRAA